MTMRISQLYLEIWNRHFARCACFIFLFCALTGSAFGQYAITHNFTGSGNDGSTPFAGLVQGTNGNLYGTTQYGGSNGQGIVFEVSPDGSTYTTLYSFCSKPLCVDGANPYGGLVLATDGNLYGTTYGDQNPTCGAFGCGTIFKITPVGTLTTLHTFCVQASCPDGANPYGSLMEGLDGNLYGMTSSFGHNGLGTAFKISLLGKFTVLHSFGAGTDGGAPFGGFIQAADGTLYGMASTGGTGGDGTVFKMTTTGKVTTLHNFSGVDGSTPYGTLAQTFPLNGQPPTFYGTTYSGGAGNGTIFKITPDGTFTQIFSLCPGGSCLGGSQPLAGMIITADSAFYGTTAYGGTDNNGVLLESTDFLNTYSIVHNFCGDCGDGSFPQAPVFQHTNGALYGTASGGGAGGVGTVYSVAEGEPFVSFVRNSGKVGQTFEILGQGLSGTSQVLFAAADGGGTVAAKFKVISANYMTATVPANSLPSHVTVQTPSSKLISNVPFLVEPQIRSISPTSGPVGTVVSVAGNSFLTTRSVTVGGVPATYALDNLEIFVTVPSGAKTGKIVVTTDGGVATSSAKFTVTP